MIEAALYIIPRVHIAPLKVKLFSPKTPFFDEDVSLLLGAAACKLWVYAENTEQAVSSRGDECIKLTWGGERAWRASKDKCVFHQL